MRALGVDYGERKIGLAISDESALIATPMLSLKVSSLADAVSKIQRIAKSQDVDKIIVGLPLGPKREETKQSIQTRYFTDTLKSTDGIEIEFWNESFSTQQAKENSKSGTSRKKRNLDSEVARALLQEYLDYKREPERYPALLPQYQQALAR